MPAHSVIFCFLHLRASAKIYRTELEQYLEEVRLSWLDTAVQQMCFSLNIKSRNTLARCTSKHLIHKSSRTRIQLPTP